MVMKSMIEKLKSRAGKTKTSRRYAKGYWERINMILSWVDIPTKGVP